MTPDEWDAAARQAVLDVAADKVEFTPDDIWDRLDALDIEPPTAPGWSTRRLGNIMSALQRQGLIEKQAVPSRTSRRKERHSGMVAVWSSPGMSWLIPDALPVSRAMRGLIDEWAAEHGCTPQEAAERLLKQALAGKDSRC